MGGQRGEDGGSTSTTVSNNNNYEDPSIVRPLFGTDISGGVLAIARIDGVALLLLGAETDHLILSASAMWRALESAGHSGAGQT